VIHDVRSKNMSYYAPTFGNIEAGWYSDDKFDATWTQDCDALLTEYADRYAPFLLAYIPLFQKEVLARFKIKLTAQNIDYAILSKAAKNPKIISKWRKAHQVLEGAVRECFFCAGSFGLLDTHPNVIRNCGTGVRWCRGCNYNFWRYAAIWSDDLEAKVQRAKQTAHERRKCNWCSKGFNLLKHFYSSRSFSDQGMVLTTVIGHEDFAAGHAGVDFLYPNLFVDICPECFAKCFHPVKTWDHGEILAAMRRLGEMIGKIPTQDFDSYIYLFSTPSSITDFISVMHLLPNPAEIKARFGSFFGCIAKSGLLPDGAKRMKIGTMVLADDGDLCFSLPERDIDNWLFSNGIKHQKEVKYPDSDLRCDWEIFGFSQRIFVEYFGLMNRASYADKARMKTEIAQRNGIHLIEIFPDTDWKHLLKQIKTEQGGGLNALPHLSHL